MNAMHEPLRGNTDIYVLLYLN